MFGIILGGVLVALDEILRMAKVMRIPPLAVGLGMYLPIAVTMPVVIGAVIGWIYEEMRRRVAVAGARQTARRAAGLGPDRGREPVRRDQRGPGVSAAQTGLLWMPKDAPSAQAPLGVLPAEFPESALGVALTSCRVRRDHRSALSVAPRQAKAVEITGTARGASTRARLFRGRMGCDFEGLRAWTARSPSCGAQSHRSAAGRDICALSRPPAQSWGWRNRCSSAIWRPISP